jgi:hypothetical protein
MACWNRCFPKLQGIILGVVLFLRSQKFVSSSFFYRVIGFLQMNSTLSVSEIGRRSILIDWLFRALVTSFPLAEIEKVDSVLGFALFLFAKVFCPLELSRVSSKA